MATDPQNEVPTAPREQQIWRIIASVLAGVVAAYITAMVLASPMVILYVYRPAALTNFGLFAAVTAVSLVVAFFVGGVVGRRVAGPEILKDGIGIATAALCVVLTFLNTFVVQSPFYTYVAHSGWHREPRAPIPATVHNMINNLPMYVVILLFACAVAYAGDRWMSRRQAAKQRPRLDAQA
jgi:CDP-diglyceride synthetase